MDTQKLFKSSYVTKLVSELNQGSTDRYLADEFEYNKESEIPNLEIKSNPAELMLPNSNNNFDFENSKIIFESFPTLNPVHATDGRLWTYLTHVTYWKYMKARRPVENQPVNKRVGYILDHWFVSHISAQQLLRNDISLLWWVSYLTYDESRKDPYELTREVFSMLDYTRHLLSELPGRNRDFTHALLEYVIENPELFRNYKESKIRFIMRKINFLAGYKMFPGLSKTDIKEIFEKYKSDIALIKDEKAN